MRIATAIFIGIHGIIHLFGFLKAFGLVDFNSISQPISKTFGAVWLVGFLLFLLATILLLAGANHWRVIGIAGIAVSQFLILNYWGDAKYGTAANAIILVAVIIGYSTANFQAKIKRERSALFDRAPIENREVVTKDAILGLPPIVQKWLTNSGTVGGPLISNVYLTQELQLKMKPEQSDWNRGLAEQYFTTHPPAFNWSIDTEMNALLRVAGRDKFENGKGEMVIKLLSLIPVADAKNDEKIDRATLQRYLAEIVWFPSAALSEYIKWEEVDDHTARATMAFEGTRGSGEFYFDDNGNFEQFTAMRYRDAESAAPTEWTVVATNTEERNGILIPVECEASWKLEEGEWTWLKLKIKDIQYNMEAMPTTHR